MAQLISIQKFPGNSHQAKAFISLNKRKRNVRATTTPQDWLENAGLMFLPITHSKSNDSKQLINSRPTDGHPHAARPHVALSKDTASFLYGNLPQSHEK